ncbi:hypothetical protein [Roseiterribacter gracilis]|uniref:Uncharacterized protein n=1 Tax=Roseiterribacter gracilis TaxID=2812848 RepID=A0A8S8XCU5_9PROT|nr:hypothetical protein TMPK1_13170 [Rhodospirillales bacterium TMPK1]
MLNCARITYEIEQREGQPAPEKLLFRTKIFNDSVLIKDRPPFGVPFEGSPMVRRRRRIVGTKIYMPYDRVRPAAGGRTVFFGTPQLGTAMNELLDLKQQHNFDALEADNDKLEILDSIPSFAPFLVRERCRAAGIEIDPAYFAIETETEERLNAFAHKQYGIVADALQQGRNTGERERQGVIDALWGMRDAQKLNSLARLFRLPTANAPESFFAWKGVVYLQFERAEKAAIIAELQQWLDIQRREAMRSPVNPADRKVLNSAAGAVSTVATDLETRLQKYRTAFDSMFVKRDDYRDFSNFLADASEHFQAIGIAVAKLSHLSEIWQRATQRQALRFLNDKGKAELVRTLLSQVEPQPA